MSQHRAEIPSDATVVNINNPSPDKAPGDDFLPTMAAWLCMIAALILTLAAPAIIIGIYRVVF